MENFKFGFFSLIILALIVFISYWAFSSIESGSSHLNNQEIKDLTKENKDLKDEVSSLKNEIVSLKSSLAENTKVTPEVKPQEVNEPVKTDTTTLKYQSLIDDLQKFVDDNINMKKGSQGTRVGTVQKFLNIYNNTSTKIDNDYGTGTENNIKKFQSDQGVTSDGQAGPGTFRKMIEWLKTQ